MDKNCKQPDRDFPKLVCGFPFPCPYHTILIDSSGTFEPSIPKRVSSIKIKRRIEEIQDILSDK